MAEFVNAVVKITGNAFLEDDDNEPKRLAEELADLRAGITGHLVVCVGGGAGNRGREVGEFGVERLMADERGMRKSMHNASRLADAIGDSAVGFRALELRSYVSAAESMWCDPGPEALRESVHVDRIMDLLPYNNEVLALKKAEGIPGGIVVVGGGIGRGHVSTDFGAALWARALVTPKEPTVLLKGSDVDHIYTDNPKLNPAAKPLYHISYKQARDQGLEVVDLAAWPVLEGGGASTIIYMDRPEAMRTALALEGDFGTLVDIHGMRMTA